MDLKSNSVTFVLPLDDDSFYSCGTSKLRNKLTGTKVFYHRVVIDERIQDVRPSSSFLSSPHDHRHDKRDKFINGVSETGEVPSKDQDDDEGGNWTRETVTVKCIVPGETSLHPRFKRQLLSGTQRQQHHGHGFLPDNFTESSEELTDFSGNITAQAPLPLLNIAVKQNGEFVDTALNVSPGTPLEMIIYLDDVSANVYGLLASFLRVTDNTVRKQEEIIILNG